jgi:hypothetical protein
LFEVVIASENDSLPLQAVELEDPDVAENLILRQLLISATCDNQQISFLITVKTVHISSRRSQSLGLRSLVLSAHDSICINRHLHDDESIISETFGVPSSEEVDALFFYMILSLFIVHSNL